MFRFLSPEVRSFFRRLRFFFAAFVFQENKIINNIKTVVIAVGAVETVEKSVEYPELFLAVT